ncbi:MAG: NgoFVII family restriction endonuclease [Fusobacteriaceae bacterium]|nr:NgoFVII family restriction endonuclease [Fusobacteriaceae bacterium]
MFLENQNDIQIEKYYELLKIVGGLSNLFSESTVPYLYYRAAENIFCKAFGADNLSRSDCSADARKEFLGIGLKTFLNGNGKTYQKVAEFNKERGLYIQKDKNTDDIIKTVSELRNKRISSTQRIHNLDNMIYHCVSRTENQFLIFEEKMDLININKISNISNKNNSITFEDGINEYNFNLSKSTLLKRFYTPEYSKTIDIDIIKNPFDFLEDLFKKYKEEIECIEKENTKFDFVILPLYSHRNSRVEEKSGLNQWNANGRKRNEDEIYIPIPSWIHKIYPDFFPTVEENFNLILPNKQVINAKVCQSYSIIIGNEKINKGKAIMSNPNNALGKWLLRDVLKLPYGKIVKIEDLYEIGIDSVEVKKIDNKNFEINFKKQGSFEEFYSNSKNK